MGGANEVKGVRHEGSLVSKIQHPKNPFLGSLRLGSQREPRGIPRELRSASSPGPAGEAVRGSTHSQGLACPPSDVQRQPDPSSEAMGPSRPALPSTTKLGLWWLLLIDLSTTIVFAQPRSRLRSVADRWRQGTGALPQSQAHLLDPRF